MKKIISSFLIFILISQAGCANVKPSKALLDQYNNVNYVRIAPIADEVRSPISPQITNYYNAAIKEALTKYNHKLDKIEFVKNEDTNTVYALKSVLIGYNEVGFGRALVQAMATAALTLGFVSIHQYSYIAVNYELINLQTAETLWTYYANINLGQSTGQHAQQQAVTAVAQNLSKSFPYYKGTPMYKKVAQFLGNQNQTKVAQAKESPKIELASPASPID